MEEEEGKIRHLRKEEYDGIKQGFEDLFRKYGDAFLRGSAVEVQHAQNAAMDAVFGEKYRPQVK